MVGMFYQIENSMHYVILSADLGDQQDEYLSTNTTHYEWWRHHIFKLLKLTHPQLDKNDFDHFPRGRVIYDRKADIFELNVDRCIRKNKQQMQDIFQKNESAEEAHKGHNKL